MANPFSKLGRPKPQDVEYDEWGGQFSCDTEGCWEAAHIAKYLKKQRILTWVCPEGHVSVLENVNE